MGIFKCVKNKDGVVVLVHNLDAEGGKLGRITFDENERFAESQIQEGEFCTVSYYFTKFPEQQGGQYPEE